MTEICKLCLKKKKLCNSHIIPEFFFKNSYDEKHRMVAVSPATKQGDKFIYQKAPREYLLCVDCEGKIAKFEKYASERLDQVKKDYKIILKEQFFDDVDYKLFKLFQLSILWRASASTLFPKINLGKYENIIRQMILHENPKQYYDFGCIMMAIVVEGELFTKTIDPYMLSKKIENHKIYKFFMGGICWDFCVGENSERFLYRDHFLQENNLLPIIQDELLNDNIILHRLRTANNEVVIKGLENL